MFEEFPKMARLSRECVITEKIDGTNAQIEILMGVFLPNDERVPINQVPPGDARFPDGATMFAGSRTRYIWPGRDNHGFAAWAWAHRDELWTLGEGRHFGEWWGSGVQRGYGLIGGEKRFSLFNVARWADDRDREKFLTDRPACCGVVPVLYRGDFHTDAIERGLLTLRSRGSVASPGFMRPEGIVIWHEAARVLFKKTLDGDGHKGARVA
jgi:hypothetical protein